MCVLQNITPFKQSNTAHVITNAFISEMIIFTIIKSDFSSVGQV